MQIITLICISLFFFLVDSQNSAPLVLSRNYFITSGRFSINLKNILTTPVLNQYQYTYPIVDTLFGIANIYYTTTQMDAQTYQPTFPTNSILNFIWYQIDTLASSFTYITTSIFGYFQVPYISQFTFSYLLILKSNILVDSYFTINEIQFNPAVNTHSISFPSNYQSGDTLRWCTMIKQIRKIYEYQKLQKQDFQYYIMLKQNINSATNTLDIDIILPNYVTLYADYSIKYLVILIDITVLALDYPRYRFDASSFATTAASFSLNTSPKFNNIDTHAIFGISQYCFYNYLQPSFSFIISVSSSNYVFKFYGNIDFSTVSGNSGKGGGGGPAAAGNSPTFTYSNAIFPYFDCDQGYPLYNQTQDLCYDNCTQTQYFDSSLLLCQPCSIFCETCYDSSRCRTCKNGTFRSLLNFSCMPIDGYYESNASIASICSTACVTCSILAANCTLCKTSIEVLINNTCINCNQLFQGCSNCNQTACFICNNTYRFINQSFCNLPCTTANCVVCSNQNTSLCLICEPEYTTSQGTCLLLLNCGDNIINPTQQCDDGNHMNHDGCSNFCTVQQDYKCYSMIDAIGNNITAYCSYLRPINFTIISLEKVNYVNQIRLILSVQQYLQYFWNTKLPLGYFFVQSNIPYRNMKAQFLRKTIPSQFMAKLNPLTTKNYPENSLIIVVFEYLGPIHGEIINIGFNFSQANDYLLNQIPYNGIAVTVIPQNNHYAHYYSSSLYNKQKILSNMLSFISLGALILFLLSFIFGSKRISTEMLVVIQIAYASIITAPKITPMISALTSLSPAYNGFNILYSSSLRPFEDTLIPYNIKGMDIYSQFLYNLNLGLIIIVIPLISALILHIIKMLVKKQVSQKIQKICKQLLTQYMFMVLMFASCMIGVSSMVEFIYGVKELKSQEGMLSLLLCCVFLAFYPIYGIIRVKKSEQFEQYNLILQKDGLGVLFQIIYFYLGLVVGIICISFHENSSINIIICVFTLILFTGIIMKPIYVKYMDQIRTYINLLTIIICQILFFSLNISNNKYTSQDNISILFPISIGIILFINFIINLSFIIYQIIKKIRNYIHKKQLEDQEEFQKLDKIEINKPIIQDFILLPDKSARDLNQPRTVKGEAEIQEMTDIWRRLQKRKLSRDNSHLGIVTDQI